jgi:hypothetical protein
MIAGSKLARVTRRTTSNIRVTLLSSMREDRKGTGKVSNQRDDLPHQERSSCNKDQGVQNYFHLCSNKLEVSQ